MRWRWWRPEPIPGGHHAWPDHGRDAAGRQLDGDRVRPDGWRSWADLLPGDRASDAGREALTDPTARPAAHDPAQQWRSRGGRR